MLKNGFFLIDVGVNECESVTCLNGGKCVNLNTEDASSGVGSGMTALHKCVCAAGYTGKLCETGTVFVFQVNILECFIGNMS